MENSLVVTRSDASTSRTYCPSTLEYWADTLVKDLGFRRHRDKDLFVYEPENVSVSVSVGHRFWTRAVFGFQVQWKDVVINWDMDGRRHHSVARTRLILHGLVDRRKLLLCVGIKEVSPLIEAWFETKQ